MSRLLAALAAALLTLTGTARAQQAQAPAPAPKDDARAGGAARPAAQGQAPADARAADLGLGDLDPKTRAAIQRAVEKAKEEIREEVRAEMQVAQSSAEFMGTVAEGPKLELLELDGYFRVRGQLSNNFDLGVGTDTSGFTYFPVPLQSGQGGTLATANMRLRLEPTLNVSEHVRVRAQVDVLDNYVLGSSTSSLFDTERSPFPAPFYGSSRRLTANDPTADRDAILPKRAWAEIQTPVGLLSFGRMPSSWGLGILANAGGGIDDDYGDTVDRLQFTLPPLETPLGKLTLVPMLDFDAEGVLNADPRFGLGVGQPFDADKADDARTYAVKLARLDTEDEIRRKLDGGGRSVNFGAYYNYRNQRYTYPAWRTAGFDGAIAPGLCPNPADTTCEANQAARRAAYAHVLDLWFRHLTGRWRVEAEAVGIYGNVGETFTFLPSAGNPDVLERTSLGRVLLRQWGAVLQTDYQALPNKVTIGAELGIASGDSAPGFGNVPDRLATDGTLPTWGSVEGPQYGLAGDRSIKNFRFNPGYRVDLILWRGVLGQVTDAWYLRPRIRWDILPGLTFDGNLVYSQALYSKSTPSSLPAAEDPATPAAERYTLASPGKKPLGVELDGRLTLQSGNGFVAFGEMGVFEPFGGISNADASRGWALNFGFGAKF